jgi:hypothetical protein
MTFDEYILNPMGKNNAVLSALTRETIRKDYSHRFDNILLRENGKIEYYLYHDEKTNAYYAHIKVPSEVVKDFYYDTIIKFYRDASLGIKEESNLFKYQAQFFSNDPAFVYTYAYVFRKHNLFIPELASKMSREALKEAAKEKNPGENVGYVKSLYFAYLVMENRGLNKLNRFNAESEPLMASNFLATIMDADEKIEIRQREGAKVSKRKKIRIDDKTLKNIQRQAGENSTFDRLEVKSTKKVKNIQSKNASKNTKKTGKTRIVKKK